jgi:hypothetical protein
MTEKKVFLIFCSFEVGGLPFKMAEILNRHGVRTLYASIDPKGAGHNSKEFHYGRQRPEWDRSALFEGMIRPDRIASALRELRRREGVGFCLATGHRSYVLRMAGIPYVYWCYGSDLDEMCFLPLRAGGYDLWLLRQYFLKRYSKPIRVECRRTMRSAEAVVIAPYQRGAYDALGLKAQLRFFPHFLELPPYEVLAGEKEESRLKIGRRIGAENFFFSAARHVWAGDRKDHFDNKGNDVVLRIFREYLQLKGEADLKLVLIEKGEDVSLTRELAGELGLSERISWVKEMPRSELTEFYRGAQLCFGQVATPCLTFAALEPLAQGTPCASWFDWDSLAGTRVPNYGERPPVIDSADERVIARTAAERLSDAGKAGEWSRQSWSWVERNCSEKRFVEGFLGLFA